MREVTGAMLCNELSWRPNPHRLGSEVAARPFGLSSAPVRATCPCRPALDDSVHSVLSCPRYYKALLSGAFCLQAGRDAADFHTHCQGRLKSHPLAPVEVSPL